MPQIPTLRPGFIMLKETVLPTPLPLGTALCCNVLALPGSGHSRCRAELPPLSPGPHALQPEGWPRPREGTHRPFFPQTLHAELQHPLPSPPPRAEVSPHPGPRDPILQRWRQTRKIQVFKKFSSRQQGRPAAGVRRRAHRGCARSSPAPSRSAGGKSGGQGLPHASSPQLDPPPKRVPRLARPGRKKAWCGLSALPRHRPASLGRCIPGAGEARDQAAAPAMRSRWLGGRAPRLPGGARGPEWSVSSPLDFGSRRAAS